MPDTTDNIIVQTVGTTASIATDYGTSGVGVGTAHLPLNKIIYGNSGEAVRVSTDNPLPITVSGSDVAITVSGNVGNSGPLGVQNYINTDGGIQYIAVAGSTAGAAIGVTGSIEITSANNPLRITGGRRLSALTDSIEATGSVTIGDTFSGITGAAVGVYSGIEGKAIGASGDALKVAVVDAEISANVTLSSTVGVTNGGSNGTLKVEGVAGGVAVPVSDSDVLSKLDTVTLSQINQPTGITAGIFYITTASKQLPHHGMSSGVNLRAQSTNTASIYLGGGFTTGTNGYPMSAGESLFLECNNLNLLYAVGGATGQSLNYLAS
jgi:hypothetical protein